MAVPDIFVDGEEPCEAVPISFIESFNILAAILLLSSV